eukprot:350621-Chlamydomonas_euryale.AAC.10
MSTGEPRRGLLHNPCWRSPAVSLKKGQGVQTWHERLRGAGRAPLSACKPSIKARQRWPLQIAACARR